MLKTILTTLVLPIALLFGRPPTAWANSAKNPDSRAPTGTLQKMVVENGSVTIDLDLNRLNGIKDLKNLLCFRGECVRKIMFSKCLA
jgi:hypothetical protein